MKQLLLLFSVLLWTEFSFCQNYTPEEIRSNPQAPAFAKLSVSPNVNYYEVLRSFLQYEKEHPVVKKAKKGEQAEAEHEEEEETDPWRFYFKRWNSRVKGWIKADGTITDIHTDPNIKQYLQAKKGTGTAAKPTAPGWRLVGPTLHINTAGDTANSGSNIYCVHFNTSNPSIGFCGTETGYIFKTTDGGDNWSLISNNMIFYGGVRSVVTEPGNANTVYAGDLNGMYKSTDGGVNWTNIYWGTGVVWSILINPLRIQTLIAATSKGVYQSYDAGASFSLRESGKVNGIEYKPGDTTIVYAFITKETPTANYPTGNYNTYVYKSINGGQTFLPKPSGWYGYLSNRKYWANTGDITVSAQNPNIVYALLLTNEEDPANPANTRTAEVGILKSTDAGESWTFVKGPWQTPNLMTFPWSSGSFNGVYWQGDYNNWIIANPANSNQLIAGGLSGYRSTDGGVSWSIVTGYSGPYASHPDHQNFAMSGSTLWIANDGGILKSTDFLASAPKIRSKGIFANEFWGFGVGWNQEVVTGGRYHNGDASYYKGVNPPQVFIAMGGGESATGYVSPHEPKVYYSDIPAFQLSTTFPNVQTIASLSKLPNESTYGEIASNLIYHPNRLNTMYLGKDSIFWKSTDGGASFSSLYAFSNIVTDFDIPLSAPDTIMLSTWPDDKVWRSVNGGTSFSDVTGTLPAGIKKLSVNALNAKDCWALIAGSGTVYRTTDAGNTWTSVGGGNLAGKIGYDITVQGSTTDPTCYVACNNGGVFYKNNSTAGNWVALIQDLPAAHVVRRLEPFYNKNKIFLGTGGIGIWEHDMVNPVQPFANFASGRQVISCSKDTLRFSDYSIVDESVSPASRTWSFPGAAYVNTTDPKHPRVLYNTPGNYNVTLSITDANNVTSSRTLNNFITFGPTDICKVDTVPGLALNTNLAGASRFDIGGAPINSNNFTVSVWVKPMGNQNSFSQILGSFSPDLFGIGISYNNYVSNLNLVYSDNNIPWSVSSTINLDSNAWNYITLVYTPTGVTLYKNGQAPGWSYTSGTFNSINLSNGLFINPDNMNQQGYSNFKGEIDEIAFYNTALSLAQIREQMHLTKTAATPNLVKYIQFNQYSTAESSMYDAVGSHTATIPPANMIASNDPVGSGSVQTLNNVNAAGTYTFGSTGMSITLPASGTYPNGTLVGFKLNVRPDTNPGVDSLFPRSNYWIVNNYGSNATFSQLSSIKFAGLPKNPNYSYTNSEFKLYKRSSVAHGATWGGQQDVSDLVTVNANSIDITFSTANNITSFSQLALTANNPAVLPIRNMKLKAGLAPGNNNVKLDGTAELDEKIKTIAIERSHNSEVKIITEKDVESLQVETANISYTDNDVMPGNKYLYRLVATTEYGAKYYGLYQPVDISLLNGVFNAYPNPAGDWITFAFGSEGASTGSIIIRDVGGRMVKMINTIQLKKGANKILCSMQELAHGVYEATLSLSNGQSYHVKISKAE